MATVVRDDNRVPDLLKVLDELTRKSVEIGVFGEGTSYDKDNTPVSNEPFILMVARVNEFGMTIQPKHSESLAIPLPIAKDTRPSDHDDLFRPKGTNVLAKKKGKKDFVPYFVLVKSVTIPERSFIRSGYDNAKSKLEKLTESLMEQVLSLKITPQTMFERIGMFLVSEVQRQIRSIKSPPNSKITADRKKSNNPLIDTGRLRQAITYRVVDM